LAPFVFLFEVCMAATTRRRVSKARRTRVTATQLEPHDHDWLRAEAARRDRTISYLLRQIVRAHIAEQTQAHGD
jgi:hypothetical protein